MMNNSISGSMSIGLSKNSVDEDLFSCSDAISNESITKGISISGIYDVISDPIKGGMGSVWKVHHNGWNMDLAMKRPLPKYFAEGSERRKENFIRECEDWIDLGLHPNIVSCYYVREIGGVPTIFSEWMENGSLESRIKDQTLYSGTYKAVQERLLDIAIQFARGLHYAHESKKGLIHQDVKPDNLLLTLGWDAKVADFGLARARTKLEEDSRGSAAQGADSGAVQAAAPSTEPGTSPNTEPVVAYSGCTPAYCSYEQDAKKPVSRQTDIYSWALSVLEMYLGSRPWKSGPEAGNRFRDYLKEERFRVKIPDGMSELLGQCLAEDPSGRPQGFGEIIAKLQDIYQETIGEVYPRPEPDAAPDTADSLNNRALSYLDLGKDDQAEGLWEQALEKDATLADAVFNRALFLRRRKRISYNEAEEQLLSIPNYLTREDYHQALIKERRILDLDIGDFIGSRDYKGLNFTSFSDDRRRGAGIRAVRDQNNAASGTHFVMEHASGKMIFTDPAPTKIYSTAAIDERTLLTRDGKLVLVNRHGKSYGEPSTYGDDVLYEVDSGTELWRRRNQCEMFMLSPDDRFAVGNRFINKKGEDTTIEVVILSMENGEVLHILKDQGGLAGFTPDGRMLLGGKIYYNPGNYIRGEEVLTLCGRPEDYIEEGAHDESAAHDSTSGRTVPVIFEGVISRALCDRCWIPMKNGMAVFCGDYVLYILDPAKGTIAAKYELGKGAYGKLDFAALLDDESLLIGIWTYRGEQTALIWDVGTGELLDQRALGRILDFRNLAWMIRSSHPVSLDPSIPADYRLSLARGLRDREETQKRYRELLDKAKKTYETGDPFQAMRLAEEAANLPGFIGIDEPLRLSEEFAKGFNKFAIIRLQMTEDVVSEKPRRPLPDEEDEKRFSPGIKAIRDKLYAEHESNIDTEVYAYINLGEYSRDRSRIIVYTELIEEDVSPFRPSSQKYGWYGAGVLDAQSGELVYFDSNLYYRGSTDKQNELHHGAVLDHSGRRLLDYSSGLRIRSITGGSDVKELGTGEFLFADFMDDDRYVLCMDNDHRLRVIDSVKGRRMIQQVYPETEYGIPFCLEGESFGIPHYGKGFRCRIVWDYYRKRQESSAAGGTADRNLNQAETADQKRRIVEENLAKNRKLWLDGLPKRVRAAVNSAKTPTKPILAEKASPGSLLNAIKAYASGVKREEIIAIEDITFFLNGKKGFLYTGKAVYSSFLPGPEGIRYEDIAQMRREGDDRLWIRLSNGKQIKLELGRYQDSVMHMLRMILMM